MPRRKEAPLSAAPFLFLAGVAIFFHSLYFGIFFLVFCGAVYGTAKHNTGSSLDLLEKEKAAKRELSHQKGKITRDLHEFEPQEEAVPDDPDIPSPQIGDCVSPQMGPDSVAEPESDPEEESLYLPPEMNSPEVDSQQERAVVAAAAPVNVNCDSAKDVPAKGVPLPSRPFASESGVGLEVDVDQSLHHLIVGKAGATIKEIKAKTNTRINLPPKGHTSDVITIEGEDEDSCRRAHALLSDIISLHHQQKAQEEEERERAYRRKREEEEEVSQETGKKYLAHQKRVDELAAERARLFELSQQAFDEGDKSKAKELADKAKGLTSEMEKAKAQACEALFSDRNPNGLEGDSVDLHGLQVQFALQKVEEYLEAAKGRGLTDVEVITGAGNHSEGGVAKIKPEVEKYLKTEGYAYAPEKNGSYRVQLS